MEERNCANTTPKNKWDTLFPFIPGDKNLRPEPVMLDGLLTVVNDVYQCASAEKDTDYLVVERAVVVVIF